ncbi:MAG TPA: hypothetical protein VFX92_02030 [Candidatus Krumholzibacteria bacterium]|nr:hypothetical protein [Candidatus Krumholzibacteria bacterium]
MNRRLSPRTFRVAAAACAALIISACGSDSPGEPPLPDPPSVSGVSENVVSPGDTITITGSNFVSPASDNSVTFTNPLGVSKPFAGNSTTLSVVVDQDATTGTIKVSHAGGSANGPAVEVERGIGDFFVFGGVGSNYELALPNPTATTRYLVVPFASEPSLPFSEDVGYSIGSSSTVPVAAALPGAEAVRAAEAAGVGMQEAFEAWRWEQTRRFVERVGVPGPRPTMNRAEAADVQEFRQFNVLKTTTGSLTKPSSFSQVTAELRYTGTKCLVYADVDTLASGENFTGADLRTIGQAFDNGIEATNVQYFGAYSDIDGNSKVIILITPGVNRLTPGGSGGFIAGFFLSVDLYSPPQVPTGTSNDGEIFYLLAADPVGTLSNGNKFPVDFTRDTNISTTAHEHEHMISFSHRIFHQGGATQVTWLEEGMAHMAEDLNGYTNDNEKRAKIYLANPGDRSLEDNTADLSQRGGIFLFLRLMADRYGDGILKQLVQSKCTGRACIANATGMDFYDAAAEFFAALYMTGQGITADERFNYTSIDLADYGTLSVGPRLAGDEVVGEVRRSAGDFYVYSGVLGSESRFIFSALTNNIRLRHVIVRVQ